MTDETNFELASSLKVGSVTISFTMKRSVKLGEEWHGFEASETWSLRHNPSVDLPPEAARKVALIHGPALIKNVVMALHVGGVLPLADAKEVIERVRKTYGLLGGTRDVSGNQSDVSGAGGAGDPADAHAGVGTGIPPGPIA